MEFLIVIILAIAVIAVLLLKVFDVIAGRGPKQVSDGIRRAQESDDRIPCPMCAERILPQAKVCPFCRSHLKT
jgi:hypothetical protein